MAVLQLGSDSMTSEELQKNRKCEGDQENVGLSS